MMDVMKLKGKKVDTDGWCGIEALTFVEFILTDNPKAVLMDSVGNMQVTALDRIRFIEVPEDIKISVLREALKTAKEALNDALGYFDNEDSPGVVEAVDNAYDIVHAALEATKEGA